MPDVSSTMPAPSDRPRGHWTLHAGSEAVATVLDGARMLRAVHGVEEVASTQDLALTLAHDAAPAGTVVLADRQVRGRGRRGRRWDDVPDGGSLAMTVLIDVPEKGASIVPLAAGLAVIDAAAKFVDAQDGRFEGRLAGRPAGRLALKWPNDVVVRSAAGPQGMMLEKLAGILVERERVASRDVLLVGIGMNVDHRALPPRPDRTCLAALRSTPSRPSEVMGPSEREAILAGLLAALDLRLDQLLRDPVCGPAAVIDDYRRASDTIGRQVDVDLPGGGRCAGTVLDVDADGALIVGTEGRTEVVVAGTVRERGVATAGSTW